MNKTLNLQYNDIFCIIWSHNKVFMKCSHGKSVYQVIWRATGIEKPARFLETAILCEVFCGNFKRKLGSILCCQVHACFCVCIWLIFRISHLINIFGSSCCSCDMVFSVSHLNTVNVFCCLCYMPCVYLKSPMLCLRCNYSLLFSKTP